MRIKNKTISYIVPFEENCLLDSKIYENNEYIYCQNTISDGYLTEFDSIECSFL